jgi:DNA-binding beta-propeller fold protein YncE
MKTNHYKSFAFTLLWCCLAIANAQTLKPVVEFNDTPRTHNFHIASDGQYLYTINGGKAYLGQISKYSTDGKLITTYDVNLDMRSLMYNAKDKNFYVCTYERNIYKITNLEKGEVELVLSQAYDIDQATLALSESGKFFYCFYNGQLNIYKFPSGKLVKILYGFDCGNSGETGSCAVAVDAERIYTWNSDYKTVFVYNFKGKKLGSHTLSKGDYGYSLSYANGMIWVAIDGNYETGKWFGYKLPY